jgi:hypothetical protein
LALQSTPPNFLTGVVISVDFLHFEYICSVTAGTVFRALLS